MSGRVGAHAGCPSARADSIASRISAAEAAPRVMRQCYHSARRGRAAPHPAAPLAGLGDKGTMAAIRSALAAAVGPELFLAVLVIGVLAGSAEELFFRGYMQTRLGQRLPPAVAVLVTSVAFGLLHLEWIHALLALVLGLYLGWITEVAGSALPAIACHVINNTLFTVLTALVGPVGGAGLNAVLLAASGCVFVGSVVWLRRARTW